jgi:16S rRNA (guanine(966)-N(2))-methyltransferase RsmD
LRIIAGKYKGRKLYTVRGLAVRPTSDRTRESIFNILDSIRQGIGESTVLDLYAGTGALGIEALSRGAKKAIFVEAGKQALILVKKNLSLLVAPEAFEIIPNTVHKALNILHQRKAQFDLIFMDPPYGKNLVQKTMTDLKAGHLYTSGAIIVCEHFIRDRIQKEYGPMQLFDERRYGQTLVSFFRVPE